MTAQDDSQMAAYEKRARPLSDLRNAAVWCYCDEYDTPMPTDPWVFPDDEHADTCGARWEAASLPPSDEEVVW